MNTKRKSTVAHRMIPAMLWLALFAVLSNHVDVYAEDDEDHMKRDGERHVKVQIFFFPGDATTPPTITRVMLHADGKTTGQGGNLCSGFSDCEGLMGKALGGPIVVIPANGSTCVTVNWGGTWRTICK